MHSGQLLMRKRRVVADSQRIRTPYSCDRCKRLKSRCVRTDPCGAPVFDNTTPCERCFRSKAECTTTMPRKKTKRVDDGVGGQPAEYRGRCMEALLGHMFPGADLHSVDELVRLGVGMGVAMPASTTQESSVLVDSSHADDTPAHGGAVLTGAGYREEAAEGGDLESVTPAPALTPASTLGTSHLVIEDRDGTKHYVGPGGTGNVLKGIINIIKNKALSKSQVQLLVHQHLQGISSDSSTPQDPPLLPDRPPSPQGHPWGQHFGSYVETLAAPVVGRALRTWLGGHTPRSRPPQRIDPELLLPDLFPKEVADDYFNHLLAELAPFYNTFPEAMLRDTYAALWGEEGGSGKQPTRATSQPPSVWNALVAAVCLVLLTGWLFRSPPEGSTPFTLDCAYALIQAVRMRLVDFITTPSIHGMRVIWWYALYCFESSRESTHILLGMVVIQAQLLGLHREALVLRLDPNVQEDCRIFFWSIFRVHMMVAAQYGRGNSMCDLSEIDLKLPLLVPGVGAIDDKKDPMRRFYVHEQAKFGILYYKTVSIRRLVGSDNVLLPVYMERMLEVSAERQLLEERLKKDLAGMWQEVPLKRYKVKFSNRLAHIQCVLLLPFFVEVANRSPLLRALDLVMRLMQQGVECGVRVVGNFRRMCDHGLLNGTVFHDVMDGYLALLTLVLTHIILKTYPRLHANVEEVRAALGVTRLEVIELLITMRSCMRSIVLSTTLGRMAEVMENMMVELNMEEELKMARGEAQQREQAAPVPPPAVPQPIDAMTPTMVDTGAADAALFPALFGEQPGVLPAQVADELLDVFFGGNQGFRDQPELPDLPDDAGQLSTWWWLT